MAKKGPDWNDLHSERPGAILEALTEPGIPFDDFVDVDRDYEPPGEPLSNGHEPFETAKMRAALPPPPDRDSLLIAAWLKRDIPARDHLLGGVMCTSSRWFIFGETGVGKTLLFMDHGAAISAARAFLNWPGQRNACVMYIDSELPVETFKERMQLVAARYGDDIQFHGYNRDALGDDGLPPLNTEAGQAWLRREIEAIKPDLIIFNSIMCLLVGSMTDKSTWMPMRPFVRELTRRHIAQVWIYHANDIGKSFGDKNARMGDGHRHFSFAPDRRRRPARRYVNQMGIPQSAAAHASKCRPVRADHYSPRRAIRV